MHTNQSIDEKMKRDKKTDANHSKIFFVDLLSVLHHAYKSQWFRGGNLHSPPSTMRHHDWVTDSSHHTVYKPSRIQDQQMAIIGRSRSFRNHGFPIWRKALKMLRLLSLQT